MAAQAAKGQGELRTALRVFASAALVAGIFYGYRTLTQDVAPDLVVVAGKSFTAAEPGLGRLTAHISWQATMILYFVANLAMVLLAVVLIRRRWADGHRGTARFLVYTGLATSVVFFFLVLFGGSSLNDLMDLADHTTKGKFSAGGARTVVTFSYAASLAPVGIVLAGFGAIGALPRDTEVKDLKRRGTELRWLMYACAATFVIGLFSLERVNGFIASFLDGPRDSLAATSAAGVLRTGVLYTSILAAVCVPVRLSQTAATNRVWGALPQRERPTLEEWKAREGLKDSMGKDVKLFSAIISPALSAPIASIAGSLLSAAT
jgi:hypothetical protein